MQFTSLNDSGLDITHAQLAEVLQPFVARSFDSGDPPRRAELRRRETKIRRKYWRRIVLCWLPSTQRDERAVISEYSKMIRRGSATRIDRRAWRAHDGYRVSIVGYGAAL